MKKAFLAALIVCFCFCCVCGLFVVPANAEQGVSLLTSVLAHSASNSSGDVFLGGRYIEIGISKGGSFGTMQAAPVGFHADSAVGGRLGLVKDDDGFENGKAPTTGDFFLPGTEETRYLLSYYTDGVKVNNITADRMGISWQDAVQMPTTVDISDVSLGILSAKTEGITKDNIKITIIVKFLENDRFFATFVTIENLSEKTAKNLRYVSSFDPDIDHTFHSRFDTFNKIVSNPAPPYTGNQYAMVVSRGPKSLESFFFMSQDSRARVSSGVNFSPNDAYAAGLWIENDPSVPTAPTPEGCEMSLEEHNGYILSDDSIAITFSLGDLLPKESVSFKLFSSLDSDVSESLSIIDELTQFTAQDIIVWDEENTVDFVVHGIEMGDTVNVYLSENSVRPIISFVYDQKRHIFNVPREVLNSKGGMLYISVVTLDGAESQKFPFDYCSNVKAFINIGADNLFNGGLGFDISNGENVLDAINSQISNIFDGAQVNLIISEHNNIDGEGKVINLDSIGEGFIVIEILVPNPNYVNGGSEPQFFSKVLTVYLKLTASQVPNTVDEFSFDFYVFLLPVSAVGLAVCLKRFRHLCKSRW